MVHLHSHTVLNVSLMLTNSVKVASQLKLVHLLLKLKCVVKVVLNVVNSLILCMLPIPITDARPVKQVSSWTDSVKVVKLVKKMIVLDKANSSD